MKQQRNKQVFVAGPRERVTQARRMQTKFPPFLATLRGSAAAEMKMEYQYMRTEVEPKNEICLGVLIIYNKFRCKIQNVHGKNS